MQRVCPSLRLDNARGQRLEPLCSGSSYGYLEEFARRGFVGVAIDARYHGERAGDLQAAMAESFKSGDGRPYIGDTVSDVWRVMDYLDTRKEVTAGRYGVMGISLGGHTTWMVSADPRVRVAVPCIAACSWKWQLRERGYMQRARNIGKAMEAVRVAKGEPDFSPRTMAAAWERWLPGIPSASTARTCSPPSPRGHCC